jgi:poly-gamma-glutamate capsule biosynthesis protein CapA/YwtB (metallophosphatase superfamily)
MSRGRVALILVPSIVAACTFGPQESSRFDETTPVTVTVVDERGATIAEAAIDVDGGSDVETDRRGQAELALSRPVVAIVSAPGTVPEPVAIGPRDDELTVRLLDRIGPTGDERVAMHFGGDVMLGRRYQEPTRPGTPVVGDSASARRVVEDLAPMAAVADATIVNLETVVGELPEELAHPGKRFLLQSPPVVADMLDELGVDLVTLGNNHAFDWKDAGVTSTLQALDEAGMPAVGSALTTAEAQRGVVVDVTGTSASASIGVVSMTTVNGDFVNDQLPTAEDPIPPDLPPAEAWQYQPRVVSHGSEGEVGYLAPASRRAGDAWAEFERLAPSLTDDGQAELWAAITAPAAYPELQDWVARRGHGGAAPYSARAVATEIERLRAAGADIVVVQFHGGFQFAEVKSTFLRRISEAAIDAGADMVISHHPHVLQGVEWYRGHLIAYSLGNLVFDQDFLATFPSAILRVVVAGDEVVEARFLPVMIDDYRPVAVTGEVAERIVRLLDARSAAPAESERIEALQVAAVLVETQPPGTERATVRFERNSGVVESERTSVASDVVVGAAEPAKLPPCLLLRADELPDGVEYGLDLFRWGGFDDNTADGDRGAPMHWVTPESPDRWSLVQGPTDDPNDDALELITDANEPVSTRFVARVGVAEHRLYDTDDGRPADASPSYTISLDARRERGEEPELRLVVYTVDDEDPTSDPESTVIRDVELPLPVADGDGWTPITIELPADLFTPSGGQPADAALLYVVTPPAFRGLLAIDNVRIYEWRGVPPTRIEMWTEVDAIRAAEPGTYRITVSGC